MSMAARVTQLMMANDPNAGLAFLPGTRAPNAL